MIGDSFSEFKSLYVFHCNHNELSEFPNVLNSLNINYLFLGDNNIKLLNNYYMKGVQQIDLKNNQIDLLPGPFFTESLRWVHVQHNEIFYISDNISNSKNLERLEASHNKIEAIPSSLKNCTKLTHLFLDNNNLKEVPDIFHNMSELENLNLSNNFISTIPESFSELSNIKFLFLNNNRISSLPMNLQKWKNLELLILHENNFSETEKQRILEALPNTLIFF